MRRAAVFLLGVSLTGNPGVTGPIPASLFILCGLCLFFAALLLWERGARPLPRCSVAVGLLAGWGLLSCLNSPAVYLSSNSATALAGLLAVTIALENGIQSRKDWRETAWLLLSVTTCSALHGLWIWNVSGGGTPLQSTFTNPDCYSVIAFLGFFLAGGLAIEEKGAGRIVASLLAIPLLGAVILTASRAGLLALAAGYVAFLFTLISSRSPRLRALAAKLFLIPSVLILILFGSGSSLPIVERLSRLGRGDDPVSVRSRWDVVRHGYKTVLRHPFLGTGLGCFHLAYQQDRTAISAEEDYMNVAHNDYMQWLVETGVPGGILWAGILLTSLATAWRSYSSPTPWVASQLSSTIAIAAYCIFNFACPVPADLLWLGAVFGLSGSLAQMNRATLSPRFQPSLFPLVALLATWGLWAAHWGLVSSEVLRTERKSQELVKTLDWEGAIDELQTASRRQPDNYRLALTIAGLAHKAFVFSGKPVWLETEKQALERAHLASSRDLQVLLTLIHFLQEELQWKEAADYISQAVELAPYSIYVYRVKAINEILRSDFTAAAATLSSIERTGRAIDDSFLAALIYLLESKSPDGGAGFLARVAAANPERATELGLQSANSANAEKNYPTQIRLLKKLRYLAPSRGDVALQLALARGQSGDESGELATLEKMRRDTELHLDATLSEQVWQRWSELQVRRGQLDLVISQLEDYLISNHRQLWPRRMISKIYLQRDQKSEARAALREGVPFDLDGSLRVELADLCAAQGLNDLARSYYREALRFSPDKNKIEARLKTLRKAPSEDEDLEN